MFTETELKLLTVPQLKTLCLRYGLKPVGTGAYKDNYITTLLAFPHLAIQQMEGNIGLLSLSTTDTQTLYALVEKLGEATTEQAALIRLGLEGKKIALPFRYRQEALMARYTIKAALDKALQLWEIA